MRDMPMAVVVAVCLVIGGSGGLARGADKGDKTPNDPRGLAGTQHSVDARVIRPNRALDPSIQAELEPGPFTIPEGYKAVNLKFHRGDPKTGDESDVLRPGNIKCVKSKRPPVKADFKKGIELAAGEYLLIVGGFPGASGSLGYTLVPDDSDTPTKTEDKPAPGERIIDVVTWLGATDATYKPKTKATYRAKGGKVTGSIDQELEPPKYDNGVTCDPLPIKGTFSGTIAGNVITGKWEVTTAAHKMHFPGIDGPDYDRTDTFQQTYESRLVLNQDGTVSETMKGSGVTECTWGPTAPKEIAGKCDKNTYEFAVPSEHVPQPMQGTWKERRAAE